tara:strand:- start:210 stop:692 length:483 start_codon:yes stop_codon:yes gene_type:complete
MIDTDKYEGHTEGPWEVLCGPELVEEAYQHDLKWAKPHKPDGGDKMGIGHLNLFFLKTPFNNHIPELLENDHLRARWADYYVDEWFVEEATNSQLMADAPLLLAEVKRLREEVAQAREYLWWCYDKERFGWEVDEEHWELIGRFLGASSDHNNNEWSEEE